MIILLLSFAVSGYILDKETGEPLPYANVMIEGTDKGVSSNDRGYFFLKLPGNGTYKIKVSYIGYKDWEKLITVSGDKTVIIKVELEPKPIYLSGISITGTRKDFEKSVDLSKLTITPAEIKFLPSFFEADVLRSLQILPGVVTMHDLSNKLYIRGGTPDEVYVSLDNIKVYNPNSHLFGLFSMFNPDIVKDIVVYTGAYPARYGGRLSGVIAILTKEGNTKKYQLNLSTGLISTIFTLQGPSPWGSFFISGRRTYFDLLVWLYGKLAHIDASLPYYFYDIIGKTTIDKLKNTKISATFMQGMDVFDYKVENSDDRVILKWGNTGEVIKLERAIGNVFITTFFSHTKFLTDFQVPTDSIYTSQGIENFSPTCHIDLFLGEENHLLLGIERNKILFTDKLEPGDNNLSYRNFDELVPYEGFLDWNVSPGPIWRFRTGLRGIYINNVLYLEPRFGIKYRLSSNENLLLSAGIYHQYIAAMNSQESYFSLYDFWKPVKNELPLSWQCATGYQKWLGGGENLKLEAYYKKYERLLIPEEFFDIFSIPSESLDRGSGYAFGFETMIKKHWKNISIWLSYGLGFTKRRIDTLVYSPRYDRRHSLNIFLGYFFNNKDGFRKNLSISFRFSLGSGLPFSAPEGWFYRWDYDYPYSDTLYHYTTFKPGGRDSGRLPPSHRLDLHIEKLFGSKEKNMGIYLDVINLYARKNVLFYNYYVDEDGNVHREGISVLPIPIITAGLRLSL